MGRFVSSSFYLPAYTYMVANNSNTRRYYVKRHAQLYTHQNFEFTLNIKYIIDLGKHDKPTPALPYISGYKLTDHSNLFLEIPRPGGVLTMTACTFILAILKSWNRGAYVTRITFRLWYYE